MLLGSIAVRGFTPETPMKKNQMTSKRKIKLRDAFKLQNNNLSEIKEKCKNKNLSIDVCFNIWKENPNSKSLEIDLDNLLKILLDVLKEHMNDFNKEPGLEIISENKDFLIYEIHCRKSLVSKDKRGIHVKFKIFENNSNKTN